MKLKYIILSLASVGIFSSCNDDFDHPVDDVKITSGDADFSNYVSLGNSLTAGYADGALYKSAQENSYPAILSSLMNPAGGGSFSQPLMLDDIGGFRDLGVPGKLQLQLVGSTLSPVPTEAEGFFNNSILQGTFNNMGVPGAKSYHLLAPGYGNPEFLAQGLANPYYARFASSPNATVLGDAAAQQPTFFSLWIGNNDLLGYATAGGAGTNQLGNLDPSTYGGNDISDPNVVAGSIRQILETLVINGGAKGVIANLPSVASIPFMTTVPAKPLTPSNETYAAQISALNEFYAPINQIFDALGAGDRKISFDPNGASGIVFVDDSLPSLATQMAAVLQQQGYPAGQAQLFGQTFGQVRQSKEGDLIPLTMSSLIGIVDPSRVNFLMQFGLSQEQAGQLSAIGLTYPADQWVLSADEVQQLNTAQAAMNAAIAQLASDYQLALADMNSKMTELQSGMVFNGVSYNTDFVSGGAFSLDGVHLNQRGYAIIANIFADAINQKFGSNLRHVNPNDYAGINIP